MGSIGQLGRQAGKRAQGRKEGGGRGDETTRAKKNPAGLNLRGVVMGFGLLAVARKGTKD
jgi:hypothetical protein